MSEKIRFTLPKTLIIPVEKGKYIFYAGKEYLVDDPRTKYPPEWYRSFTNMIKKRDNFRCVRCGSKDNIQVHHVLRVKVYPNKLLDLKNCITLCRVCHKRDHDEAQDWESYESTYNDDEQVLCERCGENYHLGRYKMCYSCYQREEER